MNRYQDGFTLVELSIVLMIIALLIGGVLKAQAMIENAQIRADIKKLSEFKMISLLYSTKTNWRNCLAKTPIILVVLKRFYHQKPLQAKGIFTIFIKQALVKACNQCHQSVRHLKRHGVAVAAQITD